MGEIFKTLFTAIIGGVAVYYIPTLIKAWWANSHPILIYNFADNGSGPRRIQHSFGVLVRDTDASCDEAWEHTSTRINPGHATCFGPYTKEIPFRGKYKAKFRIKAIGITENSGAVAKYPVLRFLQKCILDFIRFFTRQLFKNSISRQSHSHKPIVILDITHGERQNNGQFVILGLPLVEKQIRANELVDGKYKDFDVSFDYDGQSLIEFRCAVLNPENDGYKTNVNRILFDNVRVFPITELI